MGSIRRTWDRCCSVIEALVACTPFGVMTLLQRSGVNLKGSTRLFSDAAMTSVSRRRCF